MRDFHLRFHLAQPNSQGKKQEDECKTVKRYDGDLLKNIERLTQEELKNKKIPKNAGAYVLGSSDGTMFVYPWGLSPIFYIGQARDLYSRIAEHQKHIREAVEHHEGDFWPRYLYGASFGTDVVWYECDDEYRHELEAKLVDEFYCVYGSIPVANGAWPRGAKKPSKGKRDDE